MTDQSQQLDPLEEYYLGEFVPRSARIAFWLSLLSPGLGWLYLGRVGGAVATNLIFISFWTFFLFVFSAIKFAPTIPFLVFGFGWFVIIFMNAVDVVRAVNHQKEHRIIKRFTSLKSYGALFFFSYLIPIFLVMHLGNHTFWERAVVQNDAMYPSLIAGDHLLIDRLMFHTSIDEENQEHYIRPFRGSIIVFKSPDAESWLVSRVVGVPFDEILVEHDLFTNETTIVRVNDEMIIRAPMTEMQQTELASRTGILREDMSFFIEDNGLYLYPIASTSDSNWIQSFSRTLGQDEYFVINDNRSDLHDSRTFGIVEREAIIGIPLYVEVSGEENRFSLLLKQALGSEELYRLERFGRRIQ